ncbi:hypothetical protein ACI2LM_33230 [Paenibacillus lautus]|uniref:hypothetical protein n=1 Tax=Paenibacillus lautus TaxID=1401 RepID=UPI00384F6401
MTRVQEKKLKAIKLKYEIEDEERQLRVKKLRREIEKSGGMDDKKPLHIIVDYGDNDEDDAS